MKKKNYKTALFVIGLLLILTYGCKKESTKNPPSVFTVGQSYQGGIIAYIDGTGLHGFIAAPSDQSSGAPWGCMYLNILGADGTGIASGSQNTDQIMADCSEPGIAARLCGDLTLNGYSDWYLPSEDQLDVIYGLKTTIGGFNNVGDYWTSSELSPSSASSISFWDGTLNYTDKNNSKRVRAIRSF